MSLNTASSSYSFKLRNSIEQEADSALSRLDDLIKTKGYEWLDDYMQGVKEAVAKGGRRNAAQAGSTLVSLLKTPSKTPRLGTAKKTRTVLAKEKDKENRLRLANAELKEEDEDSRSRKPKNNPRSILFASALTEQSSNTTDTKPVRQMQPIVVKDAANPFIEPQTISSLTHKDTSTEIVHRADAHLEGGSSDLPRSRTDIQSVESVPVAEPPQPSREPSRTSDHAEQQTVRLSPIPRVATEPEASSPDVGEIAETPTPADLDQEHTALAKPQPQEPEIEVQVQIQHLGEMISIEEPESAFKAPTNPNAGTPKVSDGLEQKVANDDYSVPLKDDDVDMALPTSPKTAIGTSVKSSFSPSAVTFAALPTRDLPRGRSIGASKQQRMTSYLVESTAPEVLPTVKTPGPPTTAFPRPSENNAVSKAARDSKSGGTSAGSSWISRKVLAGSGGEDLRKSVAASKRPSIFDHAMEEESDQEADELDERKTVTSRASEAPNAQRFSIASKTPQPQHARQTLGPSTVSRPEQPPTNLSKMIADLQERRAVATFNASVTRATIPSLQLGRGAQGIASMGISSGLLGRAALQASLERTRAEGVQTVPDVFDEKISGKLSVLDAPTTSQAGPSTTEELNEAVDEILRKISTERQMQDVQEPLYTKRSVDEAAEASLAVQKNTVQSIAEVPSRTSSTRAEEQEVEELTKRTNALSVGTRASDKFDMPGGFTDRRPAATALNPASMPVQSAKEVEPVQADIPQSTTPTNSPPRILIYRSSHGQQRTSGDLDMAPPAFVPQENAKPAREVAKAAREKLDVMETPKNTRSMPMPAKTSGNSTPKGLSQSQAVSVDSQESDSSEGSDSGEETGDKRFDEDEVLADEVAKLAEPLRLDTAKVIDVEDSDSDKSVEEVESNGSRAPSRTGSLAASTATVGLSKSTISKTQKQAHTPASIARLIDGQKGPTGPINSLIKAQQRKAEDDARRAKRVASKEAIEKRKQDERQAKLDEMRSKEEAERKARLERLRKQKAERERLEKKRQEQEAARATETFFRDRAASVEPGLTKSTLNQSQGAKKAPVKLAKPVEPRVKEARILQSSTAKPPSRVSTVPAEIKGGPGAMRPPIPRVNTNPSAVPAVVAAPQASRVSVITKQHPLTTSTNGNTADIRAVRPNKKPSILPSQKPRPRDSTIKPTRETMKPGMNVAEFQRMIALGGAVPANMRSEDIELSDIGSDFGYESDSSESDKGEVIPSWAQSPALRKAAATQEKINPSHLFGVMPEFKMESVFDPKIARRPRSSSANWTGQDRLTEQEKLEYAKKMGYKSIDDLALLAFDTGASI